MTTYVLSPKLVEHVPLEIDKSIIYYTVETHERGCTLRWGAEASKIIRDIIKDKDKENRS